MFVFIISGSSVFQQTTHNENQSSVAITSSSSVIRLNPASARPTIKTISNSEKNSVNSAFDKAAAQKDTASQTQKIDNSEVTTISEKETDDVVATETKDVKTGDSSLIVNAGNKILLSKTIYNVTTKKYETQTCQVSLATGTAIQTMKVTYGAWHYTNVAIGRSQLAFILDWVGPHVRQETCGDS